MKKCKNCKFWSSPHEGFWNPKSKGNCTLFNIDRELLKNNSSIFGVVEGCVDIFDKICDFEFVTEENFGCVHFKKRD